MDPAEALTEIMERYVWTQRQLARQLNVTQATVSRWLKGSDPRGQSRDDIQLLLNEARGLSSDPGHGAGLVNVPHLSWVSAGNLKRADGVTSAEIERYVPVANLPRGDWIALTVDGDSMNRVAPDGSIIIVNRADDALINDRFYVFTLETGETTFKRFRRDPQPMLQPYSTNLDHLSRGVEADEVYVIGRVKRVITDL